MGEQWQQNIFIICWKDRVEEFMANFASHLENFFVEHMAISMQNA